MTNRQSVLSLRHFLSHNSIQMIVFCTCAFSLVHAFPPEVFDANYQIIQEGDIIIGAILSFHGKSRARDLSTSAQGNKIYDNDNIDKDRRNKVPKDDNGTMVGLKTNSQGVKDVTTQVKENIMKRNSSLSASEIASPNTVAATTMMTSPVTSSAEAATANENNISSSLTDVFQIQRRSNYSNIEVQWRKTKNNSSISLTTEDTTRVTMCNEKSPEFNTLNQRLRKVESSSKRKQQSEELSGTETQKENREINESQPGGETQRNKGIQLPVLDTRNLGGQSQPIPTDIPYYDSNEDYVATSSSSVAMDLNYHDHERGLHSICDAYIANFQTLENVVAILFALKEINARDDLLPNITLGVTILDDCFSPKLALTRALQFMPGARRMKTKPETYRPRQRRQHQHHKQQEQHQQSQRWQPTRRKRYRFFNIEKRRHRQQYFHHHHPHQHHHHQQQQQQQLQRLALSRQHQNHQFSKKKERIMLHQRPQPPPPTRPSTPTPSSQSEPYETNQFDYQKIESNEKISKTVFNVQKRKCDEQTRRGEIPAPRQSFLHCLKLFRDDSPGQKRNKRGKPHFRRRRRRKHDFFHSVVYPLYLYDKSKNNSKGKDSGFVHRRNMNIRMARGELANHNPTPKTPELFKQRSESKANNEGWISTQRNTERNRSGSRIKREYNREKGNQDADGTVPKRRRKEKPYFYINSEKPETIGRPTTDGVEFHHQDITNSSINIINSSRNSSHSNGRGWFEQIMPRKLSISEGIWSTTLTLRHITRTQPSSSTTSSLYYPSISSSSSSSSTLSPSLSSLSSSLSSEAVSKSTSSSSLPLSQTSFLSPIASLSPSVISSSLSPAAPSPSFLPSSSLLSSPKQSAQQQLPASSFLHSFPFSLPRSTPSLSFPPSSSNTKITNSSLVGRQTDERQTNAHIPSRNPKNPELPDFYDVVGIIGAYTSSLSVVVADVMTIFNLPQISHSATSDILEDKNKYPVFFRTMPADHYQIQTMAELLRHFEWKYVSIVFSADAYGTKAEKSLRMLLQEFDICVAQSVELNDSMEMSDYDNVISLLRSYRNARVVVLYADIKHISPLMASVRNQNAYHEFIWAGSDTTSLVSDMEEENCRHIIGSLSVTMNETAPSAFRKYLYSFFVANKDILKRFAEKDPDKIHALFREFSDVESVKSLISEKFEERRKYVPTFTVSYAIDAVYAYAHAIQRFLNAKCPGATGIDAKRCVQDRSILPYLKKVKFRGTSGDVSFNEYGDVIRRIAISQCQMDNNGVAKQVPVATWEGNIGKHALLFHSPLQWPNHTTNVPTSLCAKACAKNQIYVFPKQTCCWKCLPCSRNEITTQNKTQCHQCPDMHWPDENSFRVCQKIGPSYIRMLDLLPLSLAIVTTLGLMVSFITGSTFYIYRTDRVIRSSSRELSSIMLVGVFFAFLLVWSLLLPPTMPKCYFNHVGFSMTFTLIYGPLLVKTNRIYRIFTTSRKSAALPKRTSSAWQLLFASIFILIQVFIVSLSTSFAPPEVKHSMPVKTEKYVIRFCSLPLTGFLPALAYNLSLVLTCTWYAFKTRRLPDNYNESRYIAFCVDTTVLVWVSFIPTYFAMTRPYYKVVILALALLVNSIVCLLLLFVPKLYALYTSKQGTQGGGQINEGTIGQFHNMQLLSNFSMSGVTRSTPSFFNGGNDEGDDRITAIVASSDAAINSATNKRPTRKGSDRKWTPVDETCCVHEHVAQYVTSSVLLTTGVSKADI